MDKHRHFSLLRTILRPKSSRIGSRSRTPIRLRRHAHNPADDPLFQSVLDKPVRIISTRKKHTFLGVVTLSLIPFTAFCLGTWQIQRLDWKVKLLAKFEDRLVRPPLPLPPRIDPSAISEFDYRRVYATGRFRHDKEMLLGPRMNDGTDGFFVITPLERDQGASTVLVNRGWISRVMKFQQDRSQEALPNGEVTVAGLLREPFKKNFFTPVNKPEDGKFYFPDVEQMSQVAGSQAVWIEETMAPDLLRSYDREAKGIPIGRPAEVHLRNNHTQYIFTWYSLSAATGIMLWMVLKKKPSDIARKIRHSNQW